MSLFEGKNITCGRCRFRHPPNITCEAAKAAAESARHVEEGKRSAEAEEVCEALDAALFSGDTFESEAALVMLEEYVSRWSRELQSRNPSPYLPPRELINRRLGTLAALLRSGKIVRGGLTPDEMAAWAKQIEPLIGNTTPTKDPLLL